MVEGAVPLLRHRVRRDGRREGRQGRRHPRRHAGGGQPRPQLHEGLFPLQDHVRRRPADHAAAAQEERRLRQERRVHAGELGRGVRRHGRPRQADSERQRTDGSRHVRFGPVDRLGRLCRHQADARRLPLQQPRSQRAPLHGVGGLRLHAHLRHGRADGLLRRFRGGRRVRALGLEHGGDASDPVDASDRPPAQPPACQGRGAVHVHQSQLRSCRYPDRVQARDGPGDPQLHRQPHHLHRPGEPGLRQEPHELRERHDRHRLRPAIGPSAGEESERRGQLPQRRSRSTSTPTPSS